MTEGTRRAREKEHHEPGRELSLGRHFVREELLTSPSLQALFRDVVRVLTRCFFPTGGTGEPYAANGITNGADASHPRNTCRRG